MSEFFCKCGGFMDKKGRCEKCGSDEVGSMDSKGKTETEFMENHVEEEEE